MPLRGRGAHILAEHMAGLTKGDGATVSAGGVVGPSISLKEAYASLKSVDSRGQWELQSQDPCRNSVAWWVTILELAGRFRSRAGHVPIVTWNIGPVGLLNSFEQVAAILGAKEQPAVLCLQDIRISKQQKEGMKAWIESAFPYKVFITIAGKAVHGRHNGAPRPYWMGVMTCLHTHVFRGGRGFTLETTSSGSRRCRHAADGRALIVCATPHKGQDITVYNVYQHTADNSRRRGELGSSGTSWGSTSVKTGTVKCCWVTSTVHQIYGGDTRTETQVGGMQLTRSSWLSSRPRVLIGRRPRARHGATLLAHSGQLLITC